MGVKKLKSSVAPATRSSKKKSIKKHTHLSLVKDSENHLDAALNNRQYHQQREKKLIHHYQEVIRQALEDPEMVKKAAILLVEMIEK